MFGYLIAIHGNVSLKRFWEVIPDFVKESEILSWYATRWALRALEKGVLKER